MVVVGFACYGSIVDRDAVFSDITKCVKKEHNLKVRRVRIKNAYQQLFRKWFEIDSSIDLNSEKTKETIINRRDSKGWDFVPNIHRLVTMETAYDYFCSNSEVKRKVIMMVGSLLVKYRSDLSIMFIVEDITDSREMEMLKNFKALTVFVDSRANARSPSAYLTATSKPQLHCKTAYVTCVEGEVYLPVVRKRVSDFLKSNLRNVRHKSISKVASCGGL